MIRRVLKNLSLRDGEVPDASRQLETDGWAVLPGVLNAKEVARSARTSSVSTPSSRRNEPATTARSTATRC